MSISSDTLSPSGTAMNGRAEQATHGERAFGMLYRQFFPKVFNYVCYRVPSEAVAEDLTSTIFEKALRKMNTLRSREAFGPWLFRIARNTITDYYRQAKHHRDASLENSPEALVPARGVSLEEQVVQQETFRQLQRHLRSLSDREQEIIALKFAGGLNNRQIGSVIGESPGNVGTILYRAMRKLRREMVGDEEAFHG